MDFETQQQLLADQLRRYQGQSQFQAPQGRMAGRIYVAPNPLEYLAAGLRSAGGMAGESIAAENLQQSKNKQREYEAGEMKNFIQALRGSPERQIQDLSPTVGNDPNNPNMRTIPAVQADPYSAYSALAASQSPQLRQLGTQGLAQLPQREMMQAEKQADREARAQMLQQQIEARKEMQAQAAADRRALAGAVGGAMGGGKAPSGYRFTQTGELEAIPGGPADLKKQGAFNADTASMQSATSALDRLAEVANGLRSSPGLRGITGLRGAIPNIPGSSAADAQAQLETLKSQTAFGVLQAMRDASKTGGALGAVSEKELGLLQNNLAALDKAQSFEAYQKELDKIVRYVDDAKGRLRNAYNVKYQGQPAQVAAPAAPQIGGRIRFDANGNVIQ